VNFGATPREYASDSDEAVTLAPGGYLVTGPGFRQTKLWLDGATVKSIQADGYFVGEAPVKRRIGPVELNGRFVAFRVSPKRWQRPHRFGSGQPLCTGGTGFGQR